MEEEIPEEYVEGCSRGRPVRRGECIECSRCNMRFRFKKFSDVMTCKHIFYVDEEYLFDIPYALMRDDLVKNILNWNHMIPIKRGKYGNTST